MRQDDGAPKKDADGKGTLGGQHFIWYLLLAGAAAMALAVFVVRNSDKEISYYDFLRLIEVSRLDDQGKLVSQEPYIIVQTSVNEDRVRRTRYSKPRELSNGLQTVSGEVEIEDLGEFTAAAPVQDVARTGSSGESKTVSFSTYKPNSSEAEDQLLKTLDEYNIPYTNEPVSSLWRSIAPMLAISALFILLIFFMMRRLSGAGSPMAFGRSRGKLYAQEDIDITFDDVAGIDEAVEEVREVVDFLQSPNKYQRLGGRIPRGVLLVGPPGTGKTLLARAIAGEASVPFFSLSGSDFVEMFVGVGAARVRDMFQQAEAKAPCIIFLDELDALGKTRGGSLIGGNDEREQTLNALLVEMDGFEPNTNVIVVAATNRPETLDQALLRPGRFDRQVLVDRPDIGGREAILKVHVKNVKLDKSVDLRQIGSITPGFAGADLANLVNEAALLAARKEKNAVGMAEFDDAVERVTAGLEKKQRVMSDDEKQRVAYHESGHALVAYSLPNTDPVHKVSIIPRGIAALGYTMQRPEGDRFLMTKSELESRIQVLLAGTIAEELVYEDISTGAQNDLERCTGIARSMVMEFGMSRLGRVNYRESSPSVFLTGGDERVRSHSEKTAREIDDEVKRIIDEAIGKVRDMLVNRRAALDAMMQRLVEVESIDSDELKRIVEEADPTPRIVPGTGDNVSGRVVEIDKPQTEPREVTGTDQGKG